MSGLRITPLEPPFDDATATNLRKMMPPASGLEPLALFRVLARHLDLAERMRPLASGLLGHGLLDAMIRELVILRICARCGAEYEWGIHVTGFARAVGLDEAQVYATVHRDGNATCWTPMQALVICVVDALHDEANISDALWAEMTAYWSDEMCIELLILVGWYQAISYVANVAKLPHETWAMRFPERATNDD